MMIKNGGVSIIRSFHENALPPCFKDKSVEDNIEYLTISDEDLILETSWEFIIRKISQRFFHFLILLSTMVFQCCLIEHCSQFVFGTITVGILHWLGLGKT